MQGRGQYKNICN